MFPLWVIQCILNRQTHIRRSKLRNHCTILIFHSRMNDTLRMHDNFSICSMVEANVGVSILPELALRKMNFRIVQLPTVPPVIRRVSLVMKDPDILPIASRYFIEFFLKRADTLP